MISCSSVSRIVGDSCWSKREIIRDSWGHLERKSSPGGSGEAGTDQVDAVGAEGVHAPAEDFARAIRLVDGVAEQAVAGVLDGACLRGRQVLLVGVDGHRV